jgi:ATP-dependent Zn protease
MNQITTFFSTTRNPKYSYIHFILSDYTSLPLLPFFVLINIFLLSFVASIIYILFLALFAKKDPKCDMPAQSPVGNKNIDESTVRSAVKLFEFAAKDPRNNSIQNQQKIDKIMTGGTQNSHLQNIKNVRAQGQLLNNNEVSNSTNSTKQDINYGDKLNSFIPEYFKSLINNSLTSHIFSWFIYIIIFQLLYFIIFLILLKSNVINQSKLNEELYIKSIVHYYISGFYISSSIIYFYIMSNS